MSNTNFRGQVLLSQNKGPSLADHADASFALIRPTGNTGMQGG